MESPDRFSVAPAAGRVLVQGGKPLTAEGRALLAASQKGAQSSTTGNGEAKRYGASGRDSPLGGHTVLPDAGAGAPRSSTRRQSSAVG